MDTQKNTQDFIRACLLMEEALKEERPLTEMEAYLLETHVQHLLAALETKTLRDLHASAAHHST